MTFDTDEDLAAVIHTRCISALLAVTIGATVWQATLAAEFDTFIVTGVPAPDGNGSLSLLNAPAINASGQLSFVSQLTGTVGGMADNGGLFRYDGGGLVQIARTGQPLIGRTINVLWSSSIHDDGTVFGIPVLSGGSLVWYLTGDGGSIVSPFALGSPSPAGNNTLQGVITTAVNDVGITAFSALYLGTNVENGVYLRGTDGTITTLFKRQTPAPRGGNISGIANRLTINESSQVASLITINNENEAILRAQSSGVQELVREGDLLSDGVTKITQISTDSSSSLSPIPLINDAGQIAFTAQYTQPASRFGVFIADDLGVRILTPPNLPSAPGFATTLEVNGISNAGAVTTFAEFGFGGDPVSGIYVADEIGVDLVALEDTATPVPGKFFRNFFRDAIVTNAAGQVAFLAELSDTANGTAAGRGLFLYDRTNGLQQIIRTGDSLGGSTVTNLLFKGGMGAISNQSPDTSSSGLNAEGTVAFAFDLANATSGIATWSEAVLDGDFDGDGDVDGRDFLCWQRGESPNPLSSADLQLWQENYNAGNLATVVVPEPHCLMLICGILALAARRNASKTGVLTRV